MNSTYPPGGDRSLARKVIRASIALLSAVCTMASCTRVQAAHQWYSVRAYDQAVSTDAQPREAMDAIRWEQGRVSYVVPAAPDRTLIVYDDRWGRQVVLLLEGDGAKPVLSPFWGENRASGAVVAGGDIYMGTELGLLRLDGEVGTPPLFMDNTDILFTVRLTEPRPMPISCVTDALAADGAGTVWAATDRGLGSLCFSADRRNWATGAGADPPSGPCPWLHTWYMPADAMAGDPARPGLWTYGHYDGGGYGIFYADAYSPQMASLAGVDVPPPNVAYPRRDSGHTKLMSHRTSAAPEGVAAPQLRAPLIAADITGRCWLAEAEERAPSVHVFDGRTFTDVTPPPELLKASQLRQLVCDNTRGELLVATSAAGVLVFDGARWSEHPLSLLLPTIEGTQMKPVDRIAVAEDSSVWVATASYLLHWTRGEGE